jgi:hypothetical protein
VLPGKILKITQSSDIWPLIAKSQAFVIWKIREKLVVTEWDKTEEHLGVPRFFIKLLRPA